MEDPLTREPNPHGCYHPPDFESHLEAESLGTGKELWKFTVVNLDTTIKPVQAVSLQSRVTQVTDSFLAKTVIISLNFLAWSRLT